MMLTIIQRAKLSKRYKNHSIRATCITRFRPSLHGTGPLRDLIGSVPKRSHESGPKLFQIARPFTWIIHQIAKVTAEFVERHPVVEDESPPKS